MSVPDQSEQLEALRQGYGGSDRTSPSFLRPQYIHFNSVSKARDFGRRDNLNAVISGLVGSEVGAATLYFKVTCAQPTDLRIVRGRVNERTDPHIAIGISDSAHQPLPLDARGYARRADIHGSEVDESLARQPAGTYYFTVSTSQWQALPFEVALLVISYRELQGAAEGQGSLLGRLAAAKLRGIAGGDNGSRGSLAQPDTIRALTGSAGGSDSSQGALAIPRGTAEGTLLLEGRLKQTFRLQGEAGGTLSATGTLTVTTPGGGYGY